MCNRREVNDGDWRIQLKLGEEVEPGEQPDVLLEGHRAIIAERPRSVLAKERGLESLSLCPRWRSSRLRFELRVPALEVGHLLYGTPAAGPGCRLQVGGIGGIAERG